MHKLPQPVKLWYYAPMFRYERPQAGRFREHYQLGAEAIGSADPLVDAEIVSMLAQMLERARRRRSAPARQQHGRRSCRPAYVARLREYLTAHKAQLCAECGERIAAQPAAHLRLQAGGVPGGARRRRRTSSITCAPIVARISIRSGAAGARGPARPRSISGWCAGSITTRARRSSSSPTRSTARRARSAAAGGTTGWSKQIGGPPTPGVGFGPAWSASRSPWSTRWSRPRASDAYFVCSDEAVARRGLRARAAPAPRAVPRGRDRSGGARGKGQLKQATRTGAGVTVLLGLPDVQPGRARVCACAAALPIRRSRSTV